MEIKPVERTIGPATGTCLTGALARGSREPGQDLSVAAISGVLLCEGLWRAGAFQFLYVQQLALGFLSHSSGDASVADAAGVDSTAG